MSAVVLDDSMVACDVCGDHYLGEAVERIVAPDGTRVDVCYRCKPVVCDTCGKLRTNGAPDGHRETDAERKSALCFACFHAEDCEFLAAGPHDIVKHCGCGRSYTRNEWSLLSYVGKVYYDWGEVQEYRNCDCGSTLAVVIKKGDEE